MTMKEFFFQPGQFWSNENKAWKRSTVTEHGVFLRSCCSDMWGSQRYSVLPAVMWHLYAHQFWETIEVSDFMGCQRTDGDQVIQSPAGVDHHLSGGLCLKAVSGQLGDQDAHHDPRWQDKEWGQMCLDYLWMWKSECCLVLKSSGDIYRVTPDHSTPPGFTLTTWYSNNSQTWLPVLYIPHVNAAPPPIAVPKGILHVHVCKTNPESIGRYFRAQWKLTHE